MEQTASYARHPAVGLAMGDLEVSVAGATGDEESQALTEKRGSRRIAQRPDPNGDEQKLDGGEKPTAREAVDKAEDRRTSPRPKDDSGHLRGYKEERGDCIIDRRMPGGSVDYLMDRGRGDPKTIGMGEEEMRGGGHFGRLVRVV